MNLFTLEPFNLFTSLFLLLAAGVLWRCARESARALDEARELRRFAESRFATAQGVFEVARRDREIAIAANAEACRRQRNVQVDEHIVSELVRAREALDALRGYQTLIVDGHCLLVEPDFPLERYFPGAQKGATQ